MQDELRHLHETLSKIIVCQQLGPAISHKANVAGVAKIIAVTSEQRTRRGDCAVLITKFGTDSCCAAAGIYSHLAVFTPQDLSPQSRS